MRKITWFIYTINELMPSFNYVYSMDNSQRDDIQGRLDCRDALLYQYDLRAWSTNHALYSKMECNVNGQTCMSNKYYKLHFSFFTFCMLNIISSWKDL